jgi:hypothetical protein
MAASMPRRAVGGIFFGAVRDARRPYAWFSAIAEFHGRHKPNRETTGTSLVVADSAQSRGGKPKWAAPFNLWGKRNEGSYRV